MRGRAAPRGSLLVLGFGGMHAFLFCCGACNISPLPPQPPPPTSLPHSHMPIVLVIFGCITLPHNSVISIRKKMLLFHSFCGQKFRSE